MPSAASSDGYGTASAATRERTGPPPSTSRPGNPATTTPGDRSTQRCPPGRGRLYGRCVAGTGFDEWIAERYETLWPELFDPAVVDPAVDLLAELSGGAPALEFGVGTG